MPSRKDLMLMLYIGTLVVSGITGNLALVVAAIAIHYMADE